MTNEQQRMRTSASQALAAWNKFSDNILSLLSEREADKTLIAKQAKRIAELELRLSQQRSVAANNLEMLRVADAKVSELGAAAGITLDVGE